MLKGSRLEAPNRLLVGLITITITRSIEGGQEALLNPLKNSPASPTARCPPMKYKMKIMDIKDPRLTVNNFKQ